MLSTHQGKPLPSVLFATSECAPLVKTGGLADVSAALPAALREIGLDIRVLLPGYPSVLAGCKDAPEAGRATVLGHEVRLLSAELPTGVPLLVADCPALYVRGGGPYQADDGDDWEDNAVRFGVLSRLAALLGSAGSPLDWRPDVVHCNDWQTALAPVYLAYGMGPRAATVTTIHNLAFQGLFEHERLEPMSLPAASLPGLEFFGRSSYLKGAIACSDAITTVSPTYAQEIQGEVLGFGLDGQLRSRGNRLFGVLNGIDTALWNPQADPLIPSRYGPLTLEKKRDNKLALKQRLGLSGSGERPLLVMVSRLTHQKGIDLVIDAAEAMLAFPAQLAVVGTGERELVDRLRTLAARHPGNVAVSIDFDEPLAHLMEAGGDAFLMPSRFEPCGMNQMYSQRYGTPPIANATGGLVDTIIDEAMGLGDTRATGFLMREPTVEDLLDTTHRAVGAYRDPRRWRTLQLNGMACDFGWAGPAAKYVAIYEKMIGVRLGST